jgi:F0F1-type ATP synthase membrane subunit a
MLTHIFDPLEQFDVLPLFNASNSFLLTNLSLILFLNLFLMSTALAAYDFNLSNNYDFVLRNLFSVVRSMVKENLYIRKQQYFTVLFYLFLTILLANLVGLLPYSFTITSSFIFTLFLSLGHFIGINLIALTVHR